MKNIKEKTNPNIWQNVKIVKVLTEKGKYLCPLCLRNNIGHTNNPSEYQCFFCSKVFKEPIDGTLKFETRERNCCSLCNSIGINTRSKRIGGNKVYYCARCKSKVTIKKIIVIYTDRLKKIETNRQKMCTKPRVQ